jgi:PDZ domain
LLLGCIIFFMTFNSTMTIPSSSTRLRDPPALLSMSFVMVLLTFNVKLTMAFLSSSQGYPTATTVPPLSDPCLSTTSRCGPLQKMISGGFSFDDGEQVLVSVQKPLGIVLEQDENDQGNDGNSETRLGPIVVAELDLTGSAARAGIQVGDILVAVQNANVEHQSLEYVLGFLQQAPKVINLRFVRP